MNIAQHRVSSSKCMEEGNSFGAANIREGFPEQAGFGLDLEWQSFKLE